MICSKAVWLIEEIPARELLFPRVYVIGSKAVWLIEEIPARGWAAEFYLPPAEWLYVCYNQVVLARAAMRIRLVSFYWPAELVIEKKNLLSERENKIWRFIIRQILDTV